MCVCVRARAPKAQSTLAKRIVGKTCVISGAYVCVYVCVCVYTQMVSTLAPTVLLLEGGYNLAVTAACTAECVRVLLGGAPADLPDATQPPSPAGVDAVLQTLEVHASYWPVARENLDLLQEQQEVMREQEQLLHGPPSVDSVGEADLLGALLDERLVSSLDQPPNQPTA